MTLVKVLFHVSICVCIQFANSYEVFETLLPRQLYVYREFKDVQIFKFNIPQNTLEASFNLTSNSSAFCGVRNVSIYLKPYSYPAIELSSTKLSKFLWMRHENIYNITMLSNMTPSYIKVHGPVPGDWFMVAFLPNGSNKILQDGLFRRCSTWIQTKAIYTVEPNIPIVLLESMNDAARLPPQTFTIYRKSYMRYYAPDNAWDTTVRIPICYSNASTNIDIFDCTLLLSHRASALPASNAVGNLKTECSPNATCSLDIAMAQRGWNYLLIEPLGSVVTLQLQLVTNVCSNDQPLSGTESVNLDTPLDDNFTDILISTNLVDSHDEYLEIDEKFPNSSIIGFNSNATEFILPDFGTCWPRHRLVRKTFPGNFAFEYDIKLPNGSMPLIIDLSNAQPTVLSLEIAPQTDIGGTVFFEIAISPFMNLSSNNVSVVGCISHANPSLIVVDDTDQITCARGRTLRANSSSINNFADMVMVPYPEAGSWFFTLFPSCFLTNHSERIPCSTDKTSAIFNVLSGSCFQGKCGPHGTCFQYISGGFIFSTCSCKEGFRGWDCSDDSESIPNWKLLVATLLLTLSNLAFIPTIILAIFRLYLTEALTYTFTLLFSIFYHACNQPVYQYCIMPIGVLQFGDFYSAIMSFWVTIIAMSELPPGIVKLLHMIGALGIALGCEYNRTGIFVFAVPSTIAFVIMIISWAFHSKKMNQCYPTRQYILRSFLPGAVMAGTGLGAYSALQTEENYYLVHSFWHALMAFTVILVLPSHQKVKDSRCDINTSNQDMEVKMESISENWNV